MTILQSIKYHCKNVDCVKIIRRVSKEHTENSNGYIVAYSKDFIILQETDDFTILGYLVFPVEHIDVIRFNINDKYYNKIMIAEGQNKMVGIPHKINLTNWQSIFKSIKKTGLNVIVECEDPAIDLFVIGPIVKMTKSLIYILYFSPSGVLDEKPTSIDFKSITMVKFDDRYINVYSKYLRKRK